MGVVEGKSPLYLSWTRNWNLIKIISFTWCQYCNSHNLPDTFKRNLNQKRFGNYFWHLNSWNSRIIQRRNNGTVVRILVRILVSDQVISIGNMYSVGVLLRKPLLKEHACVPLLTRTILLNIRRKCCALLTQLDWQICLFRLEAQNRNIQYCITIIKERIKFQS